MPSAKKRNVNLDALIQREDFAASDVSNNIASKITAIPISELREGSGLFLESVRKPDFQRETTDWDISKVVQFIKSFVDGDFIPAVILWKSEAGLIFVIDGSHRLSALIAWINDDYGDMNFSLEAYDGEIPDEQKQIAKETRNRVNSEIGQYTDYFKALSSKHGDPELLVKARNLASRALPVQWIDGDVDTAEKSFFNINQQASPIDKTEIKLLKKRKTANCIAARAIIKAGKGHKYWHQFSDDVQETIENLANSVYALMFNPAIKRPIKTLDLPLCDKSVNALALVYEFITSVNPDRDLKDDITGQATIDCLKRALRSIQRINSDYVGSFGFHPLLYCYSNKGNFRQAAFYGLLEFSKHLETNNTLRNDFINCRSNFEQFIFTHDYVVQRIIDNIRRGMLSAKHISEYYIEVTKLLSSGKTLTETAAALAQMGGYEKIISIVQSEGDSVSKEFNTSNKSEVYIKSAFAGVPRCAICGGLLHKNSISIDHILRKRDGGVGSTDNGQTTHPYCNTGIKS